MATAWRSRAVALLEQQLSNVNPTDEADTAGSPIGVPTVTVHEMHIEAVAVVVNDYDTAIEFFVEALGFELTQDSPVVTDDGRPKRWVTVRPPGSSTAILLARADGERQATSVGDQVGGRVGFFLRVDDFDEAYNRMVSKGIEFVTAPRVEPYGKVAVFLDVAGNRWDLLGP